MRQGSGSEIDRYSSRLSSWLRAHFEDVRSLPSATLRLYEKKGIVAGWQIHPDYSSWPLYLLIDAAFPHSHIHIAYVGDDKYLHWPHVEKHGYLCLPRDGWRPIENPDVSPQQRINRALKLLEECQSQTYIKSESEREFVSYWGQASKDELVSLIDLENPNPRIISGCSLGGVLYVGETDHELTRWTTNCGLGNSGAQVQAIFGFIKKPPSLPLPKNGNQYITRLFDQLPNQSALLKGINPTKNTLVVLAVRRQEGIGIIGAMIGGVELHGQGRRTGKKRNKRQAKKNARKQYRFPAHYVRQIWQSTSSYATLRVSRCDSGWVHGRGLDVQHRTLAQSRVVVIGAGSLGSQVAARLAEAGVGNITIIDPETLAPSNIGRHELGMNSLFKGKGKAKAVASQLTYHYPHGDFQGQFNTWEWVVHNDPDLFYEADLVVSCVGEVEHDLAWDSFIRTLPMKTPTVFGWLGTQGTTGHALAVTSKSPGLSCVFDQDGALRFPDTDFPNNSQAKSEPGCGTEFQPYGPLAVGQVELLVARLSLDFLTGKATAPEHRIHACSTSELNELGGDWTTRHQKLRPDGYEGPFEYKADVALCGECPRCKAE